MRYILVILGYVCCMVLQHVMTVALEETTLPMTMVRQYRGKRVVNITTSVQATNVLKCCLSCLGDEECYTVSYHDDKKVCEKSNISLAFKSTDDMGWTSYWVLKDIEHCFVGSCYRLVKEVMPWDNARIHCEETGGHLVDIDTLQEHISIVKFLSSLTLLNDIYIAANDFEEEGVFRWSDGSLVNFTHWGWRQPDNSQSYGGEHCVEMAVFYGFMWNDVNCDRSKWSLCEYEFDSQ